MTESTIQEMEPEYVLSMEHITKIYSNGFVANKDITFQLRKGEIHGLVGENGAGKTTLMKVLFGQEPHEEGCIKLNGKEVNIRNPLDALNMGIGMVHQHFMLVQSLTVAENIVLGMEPKKGLSFDYKKAVELTQAISEKYQLPINPQAKVADLSVGYKQRVEILKMLLRGATVLLLDEPTAVLTPQETEELFVQLKNLKEMGHTIVFISHKLNEIKEICDRITVLRKGRMVGSANVADISTDDIARLVVGRDVSLEIEKKPAKPENVVLEVRDVCHKNRFQATVLDHVSFDVRAGEILGVAGVEGNGQAELSELIGGLLEIQSGDIVIGGESIPGKSIRNIRDLGVSLIHEDRMVYGVSSNQSISENMISDRFFQPEYSGKLGFMNFRFIRETSEKLIREFQVKCDGPDAQVKTLSGGNIQKVVAAREYSSKPKLLVASHPTRGIDIGAAEMIRRKMLDLRNEGTAVLLFSADLNELLTISDSIIVMYNGSIDAYFPHAEDVNENILGEYMLGLKRQSQEEIGGVIFA